MGRIFSDKNNPLAVQYYDNAIRIDTNNLQAREFKGAFYKRRANLTKSSKIYRDIIGAQPGLFLRLF